MCAKFRCAALRIKKALGIFRELIPRTTRTTIVAFWDLPSGSKSYSNAFVFVKVNAQNIVDFFFGYDENGIQ